MKEVLMYVFLALAVLGFGFAGYTVSENIELQSSMEELQSIQPVIVELEKEVEVIKEVPVEVEVEKLVEVPVDNGSLEYVLKHIYDNDGSVEYLIEDLDDDELEKIVERVDFINRAKAEAVKEVEDNLFDEIDGEEITLADKSTYEFDERDLEKLDVEDDDEDIIVDSVDFDDNDAELIISFDFEDDDDKEFKGTAVVSFDDGELDEIESFVLEEDI